MTGVQTCALPILCVRVCACVRACACARVRVCVCVRVRVCACVWLCTCTHACVLRFFSGMLDAQVGASGHTLSVTMFRAFLSAYKQLEWSALLGSLF